MTTSTPLMTQYRDIKSRYGDCVLLFRVGDFYETFYEDAVDVSRILNIALTTRDKNKPNPVPLAGVPFHAAETYITRLLAAGRNVAICEQVEDAAEAQGLVKRDVVEVLTPGTAMNPRLLESTENNYCMLIHVEDDRAAVALADVSTGELLFGEDDASRVDRLLQGKRIREVLYRGPEGGRTLEALLEVVGRPVAREVAPERFAERHVESALRLQFPAPEDRMALERHPVARTAVGVLLAYCHELKGGRLPQVAFLQEIRRAEFLVLDEATIRNLELFQPLYGDDGKATLVHLIDRTATPMGGRELRAWMQKPLCHVEAIDERLDAVAEVLSDIERHETLVGVLRGIRDMPRIAARIAARKAIPREFHALRESLEKLPQLGIALEGCQSRLLGTLRSRIGDHAALAETIERAIEADPPGHLRDGGVIRRGFSPEFDRLLDAHDAAKAWIARLEKRERERTGISTLKVGYNKVFGYFIEVPKSQAKNVPDDYVAKQTLVNAERFFTRELKEKEQVILESEEKRIACEQAHFDKLCRRVGAALPSLQRTARAVAQIDTVQSLSAVARAFGFCRPVVDDSTALEFFDGRHPVLERLGSESFVPNDLSLDPGKRQFALITGPNMSGKSTFLRQVALIVILAQMGSFVPARRARVGLVDRIFTRVGASDRLSRGESTFLVEMKETAQILEHMTDHSLILLDEIGRGTSTYDGLSIAWAVTEYILQGFVARPKALFATHFHELTQLRSAYPRLLNLKITIREWEDGIVFLRKIVAGTSDRSYGIHAARVAGLPTQVLKRAEEILHSLELRRDLLRQGVAINGPSGQISLFDTAQTRRPEPESKDLQEVRRLLLQCDLDTITPIDALKLLHTVQSLLES